MSIIKVISGRISQEVLLEGAQLNGLAQMVPDSHFEFESDLRRYETLLRTADLVVRHGGLADLLCDLAGPLRDVAAFDVAAFFLYDSSKDMMLMHLWEGSQLNPTPLELPINDSDIGWVWQNQQPLVVTDSLAEGRRPSLSPILREKGVRSYCALPLTTARRRLGGLGLGSTTVGAYGEDDIRLLRRVAELVALAVENALTRAAFENEKQRLKMLVEVSTTLVSNLDLRRLFPAISDLIRKVVRQGYASVSLYDKVTHSMRMHALDDPSAAEPFVPDTIVPIEETVTAGLAFQTREIRIANREELLEAQSAFIRGLLEQGFQSMCSVPLVTRKGVLGTLNLASKEENAFFPQDTDFLKQVATQVAIALDNARAYHEIAELTSKLKHEKLYLQDEIRSVLGFEEIIGESPALKRVLAQVQTVAPTDSTVLILGETGTGKELIARAIHRMSSRKDASFIKLNCAAIPTGLLESELFGHEKGAFTGAISQKVGRLEMADKGTLFLDEVGEIPLELQPKLLRVLQDHEFERLGGVRTIRVNLRLIAATNRDLAKSVAAHEFRDDLYYRLRVFPVKMPPLRERGKDIPLLVRYFVQKFSRSMNKHIEDIPTETMDALTRWTWPGNVRELENFIERSAILSEGTTLNVPLAELIPPYEGTPPERTPQNTTLEGLEREHILRVLRETGGVIAGLHGAAARLGMKRTTLQSRMQKMGITREDYQN